MNPRDAIELELDFQHPLTPSNLFGHLAATAIPGVEEWRDGAYRRVLRTRRGPVIVAVRPPVERRPSLRARILDPAGLLRDDSNATLAKIVADLRFTFDLDADIEAVDATLGRDPRLRPLVESAPGRRVPRLPDADESAVRAVLGQQVSTAAARTHAHRLAVAHGEQIKDSEGGLTHAFPSPIALRDRIDIEDLRLPHSRRRTLLGLVTALADGDVVLDRNGDRSAATDGLGSLRGIGPWTLNTVAMRGLGDDDVFLEGDLGIRRAALLIGLPEAPRSLARSAAEFSPYRSYATQHLWALLPHPINDLPAAG